MKKNIGTISRSGPSRAIFRKKKKRRLWFILLVILFVAAGALLLEYAGLLDSLGAA